MVTEYPMGEKMVYYRHVNVVFVDKGSMNWKPMVFLAWLYQENGGDLVRLIQGFDVPQGSLVARLGDWDPMEVAPPDDEVTLAQLRAIRGKTSAGVPGVLISPGTGNGRETARFIVHGRC